MLKVLAVLSVCLPLAYAQSGAVQSGGQPVPGVTIRATQGERALSTISDDNGAFQFSGMMPGTWSIEADLFGFEPYKKDVTIAAAPTRIDVALVLQGKGQITQQRNPGGGQGAQARGGQPAQELIAEAPPEIAPQVNSSTANDSFQIAGTVSTGLETNNRDFQGGNNGFGGPDFGPGGLGGPGGPGGDFNNGQGGPGGPGGPGGQNGGGGRGGRGNGGGGNGNFNGGGGGNFNGGGGGGGRGGGGGGGGRGGRGGQQRGLIGNRSKQGANQIRINAFDTVQDSALNARSFALNGISTPKPQSESNRYGINIGGPVILPHVIDLSKQLNFTLNYNGTIANTANNNFSSVPTQAEQAGNFSGITNQLYFPQSLGGGAIPGNIIPSTDLNPIAVALQSKFIPLPNQGSGVNNALANNYQFVAAPPTNLQQVSIRLQYTVSPKDRLSIQSQTQDTHRQSVSSSYDFIDKTAAFGQNQSVQWTHNFTPRLFNTFQVGLNRNATTATPDFESLGINVAGNLGIAGTWPDPSNYGAPTVSFGNGYTSLTDGTPSHSVVQTLSLQNSLQWRHAKHNLTFGALFGRLDQNYLIDTSGRGSFSFTGAATSGYPGGVNSSALPNTGNGYADFLFGLPQTDSVTWGDTRYYRQLNYSSWVNDDYRLFSSLSLSLGVRYEYTSPTDEKYGRLANLGFAPGFSGISEVITASPVANCASEAVGIPCVLAGAAGVPSALVKQQQGAVQPRLGLAWQAMKRGSLLIRAGFGTYYNEGIYNAISQRLGQQPQFVTSSGSLETSASNLLTLANGLTQIAPGTAISNTAAYSPNMKLPYSETWNFSVQRNLPSQLVLQINYVGVEGHHWGLSFDPNQATPGPVGTYASREPFSLPGINGPVPYAGLMTYSESGANMYSNTESVSLIRRMRNNVSFQFQYTLAKSVDDITTAQNPADIRAEYANTASVRRNQVTYTMVLESPVDQRRGFLANHGFLTKALKDWTVQTPISWGSGLPLTATVFGDIAGTGTTATERAEATGLPANSGPGFFNQAAFTTPAAGTFGNAGRDTITGPYTFSFNANMSRVFQLKERKSLEIQFNSNNILNHPVVTGFGTTVNETQTYGVISGVSGMRTISGTIRFRM